MNCFELSPNPRTADNSVSTYCVDVFTICLIYLPVGQSFASILFNLNNIETWWIQVIWQIPWMLSLVFMKFLQ